MSAYTVYSSKLAKLMQCDFGKVVCIVKLLRKDMPQHMNENPQKHIMLMLDANSKTSHTCEEQLHHYQQQMQQNKELFYAGNWPLAHVSALLHAWWQSTHPYHPFVPQDQMVACEEEEALPVTSYICQWKRSRKRNV